MAWESLSRVYCMSWGWDTDAGRHARYRHPKGVGKPHRRYTSVATETLAMLPPKLDDPKQIDCYTHDNQSQGGMSYQ